MTKRGPGMLANATGSFVDRVSHAGSLLLYTVFLGEVWRRITQALHALQHRGV